VCGFKVFVLFSVRPQGGKWRNRQKSVGSYFLKYFRSVSTVMMTAAPTVPHVAQLIKNRFFNPEFLTDLKKSFKKIERRAPVHRQFI
jgi:hypothetical protein